MNVLSKTYYYFIGAGGIGMSALARYFNFLEKTVFGYDKTSTYLTDELAKEGINIHFEDDINLISKKLNPENTLIIRTPAVPLSLSELKYFEENNFTILKRAEVLGEITKNTYGIAVAGTHGKTTTSSILGHILKSADLESTSFLGGIVENYNSNVIINGNEITVCEADEFDHSFLRLSPKLGIITSMDADHLDIYGKAEALKEAFVEFGNQVEEQLFVKKGLPIEKNALTYGVKSGADFDAKNIRISEGNYHFDIQTPKGEIKDFSIQIPGKHNVENATAAISVALYMNVDKEKIKEAISSFKGVKRRFNRFNYKDKIYVDDYAHHPAELDAVIGSLKEIYPDKKLLGIFQPHLYSRTRDFADDFAKSLERLDELILLEIYPARELPIAGITSEFLLNKVNLSQKELANLDNVLDKLKLKDFDVLLTMGAGNIDTLVKPINSWLNES